MRHFLIISFILLCSNLYGQSDWTYAYIDSLTYQQYLNKDYPALQSTGFAAIKQGIDFYYLRMRLGISYYEKKNYEKSIPHFKAAIDMNPADSIVQEYYYYALLFTGRTGDSRVLAKSFSKEMQEKVGFKPYNFLEALSVTAGSALLNNTGQRRGPGGNGLYSESVAQDKFFLLNAFLKARLANRTSLYGSLGHYTINSKGTVEAPGFSTKENSYTNSNLNFTLGLVSQMQKDFNLSVFGGIIKENSSYLLGSYTAGTTPTLNYFDYTFNHTAYAAGIGLFKRIKNAGLGLSFAMGNMGNVTQLQPGAMFYWYPLGNLNLYTASSYTYLKNGENIQPVFSQTLGGKIAKFAWLETKGSFGNHQNYIVNDGIIVYNTVDPVWMDITTSLNIRLGKFSIIPAYTYQQREARKFNYSASNQYSIHTNRYNYHLITGTLSWYF